MWPCLHYFFHLSCSPGHHVEVEHRVDDEEEVHGRDRHVVDDAHGKAPVFFNHFSLKNTFFLRGKRVGQIPELLRVEAAGEDEGAGDEEEGERGGGQPAVLGDLRDRHQEFFREKERQKRLKNIFFETCMTIPTRTAIISSA